MRYKLPKDKEALARVIDTHVRREEYNLSVKMTRYQLAAEYLKGARRFDVVDFHKKRVASYHTEKDGRVPMQMQHLLTETNRMQGELNDLNLMPSVPPEFKSLPMMQQAGTASVILDALVDSTEHEKQKQTAIYLLTYLGFVGLGTDVLADPVHGVTADFEVIHPRELLPFPSVHDDLSKVCGVVRQSLMPMSLLKSKLLDRHNVRLTEKRRADMEIFERQIGSPLEDHHHGQGHHHGNFARDPFGGANAVKAGEKDSTSEEVIRVRQLWMEGKNGTLSRFVVTSGLTTLLDIDYEERGQTVFFPIHIARFMDDGSFHGAGMFDLMFSGFRELEKLTNFLVQNTKEINDQRFLIMPAGSVDERTAFKDRGNPMQILTVDHEARMDPNRPFNPIVVDPPNAGDLPGRTAAFLSQTMERMSPVQDIIQNKGRVDSEVGLEFLMEAGRKSIGKSVQSLAQMYSGAYRSILANGSRELALSPRALPVKALTLDLVGVVIDEETATVQLGSNPLPRADLLTISVQQLHPKSSSLAKQEAMGLFQQTQDLDRLLLWSINSGVELEWWYEDVKAAHQSVVNNILRLFADGQTPGQFVTTPHIARPELQLKVLNGFMSGPHMSVASADVVEAFQDYRTQLMFYMNQVLPENVPDPVDSALISQLRNANLQGGGQGSPSPQRQQSPQRQGA